MEVIKKEIFLEKSLILNIGEDSLFFDIETLGLSSKYCPIYLIGCMYVKDDNGIITLFFAENTREEGLILKEFYDFLLNFKKIITFNGEGFDISFVQNRGKLYGLDFNFSKYESIDIYKRVRPFKKLLGLNRLNQKSLEEFLGIFREDKYDGGKLIDVYKSFEKNKDLSLKKLLILHNLEDVQGMADLFPLLYYRCLRDGSFEEILIDSKKRTEIIFKYKTPYSLPKDVRILLNNFHVKVSCNTIAGSMSCENRELKCFLSKISDYVYLPIEDMVIPKSLAGGIPKERKAKATKENCYVKDSGIFFKLPDYKNFKSYYNFSETVLYKEDLINPSAYIKIDSSDDTELSTLIKSLLKFVFNQASF